MPVDCNQVHNRNYGGRCRAINSGCCSSVVSVVGQSTVVQLRTSAGKALLRRYPCDVAFNFLSERKCAFFYKRLKEHGYA